MKSFYLPRWHKFLDAKHEIWASTVRKDASGRSVASNGWVFNNLTYLPLMKRSEWKGNPLAATGSWTAKDGRRWYTAATGRNGCRSYAEADVITALPGGGFREQRICLFNNIVMFA